MTKVGFNATWTPNAIQSDLGLVFLCTQKHFQVLAFVPVAECIPNMQNVLGTPFCMFCSSVLTSSTFGEIRGPSLCFSDVLNFPCAGPGNMIIVRWLDICTRPLIGELVRRYEFSQEIAITETKSRIFALFHLLFFERIRSSSIEETREFATRLFAKLLHFFRVCVPDCYSEPGSCP